MTKYYTLRIPQLLWDQFVKRSGLQTPDKKPVHMALDVIRAWTYGATAPGIPVNETSKQLIQAPHPRPAIVPVMKKQKKKLGRPTKAEIRRKKAKYFPLLLFIYEHEYNENTGIWGRTIHEGDQMEEFDEYIEKLAKATSRTNTLVHVAERFKGMLERGDVAISEMPTIEIDGSLSCAQVVQNLSTEEFQRHLDQAPGYENRKLRMMAEWNEERDTLINLMEERRKELYGDIILPEEDGDGGSDQEDHT